MANQTVSSGELRSNFSSIYIKVGNILERIEATHIGWIQSDGNYCYIFAKDKKFVVKRSLVKVFAFLPEESFVRIHMRYIVRKDKISKIDLNRNMVFVEDKEIAIGPKFRAEFLKKLNII